MPNFRLLTLIAVALLNACGQPNSPLPDPGPPQTAFSAMGDAAAHPDQVVGRQVSWTCQTLEAHADEHADAPWILTATCLNAGGADLDPEAVGIFVAERTYEGSAAFVAVSEMMGFHCVSGVVQGSRSILLAAPTNEQHAFVVQNENALSRLRLAANGEQFRRVDAAVLADAQFAPTCTH